MTSAREVIDEALNEGADGGDIICALHAAGYRIVPAEPTEVMIEAGRREEGKPGYGDQIWPRSAIVNAWHMMLSAALSDKDAEIERLKAIVEGRLATAGGPGLSPTPKEDE